MLLAGLLLSIVGYDLLYAGIKGTPVWEPFAAAFGGPSTAGTGPVVPWASVRRTQPTTSIGAGFSAAYGAPA